MKRLLIVCLFLGLTGCANFKQNLAIFTSDVVAVNHAIAQVSASLAQNCNGLQATGQAISTLLNKSSNAGAYLAATNAALTAWCQAPPSDIPTAIRATASELSAAKAAYASAKAGH